MKWMSVANSYQPSTQSKDFILVDSSKTKKNISDEGITDPPHPFGLYSVTRVNPLFTEESSNLPVSDNILSYPEFAKDCVDHCCKTDYVDERPLRDDALTILKQNSDFIRSILVSVRLAGCPKRNDLTPIPEGRGADDIPRPVWPSSEETSVDVRHDDGGSYKASVTGKHKRGGKHDRRRPSTVASCHDAAADAENKSLPEILRELSFNINKAMENAERVEIPPEAVLQSLREKINKCLDRCSLPYADGVESSASFRDNAVTTLSRAFSFVNAFSQGSQNELDKGRLMLLKRLGKFPAAGVVLTEPAYEHVQRSSSSFSSSDTSTSGFSDLTHTPASSNSSPSESPQVGRTVHESNATPPDHGFHLRQNSLPNKSTISNCDKTNNANLFAYQVIQDQRNFNMDMSFTTGLAAKVGTRVIPASVRAKSDSLISSYPGRRCPDFTLDVQQAEMVMKKIEERKKERCWCRVITSFVGFAFLLFSVMFFSMMLTRGEKMFGSL